MNKLMRSISYWLLVVLSLISAAVGGWIISTQSSTMTTAILDGTATGVEVYVGQSLIVTGAVILGAGIIGILLVLALGAAKALVPAAAPVVVEPINWAADAEPAVDTHNDVPAEATPVAEEELSAR